MRGPFYPGASGNSLRGALPRIWERPVAFRSGFVAVMLTAWLGNVAGRGVDVRTRDVHLEPGWKSAASKWMVQGATDRQSRDLPAPSQSGIVVLAGPDADPIADGMLNSILRQIRAKKEDL